MKLIIAGGRNFIDYEFVVTWLDYYLSNTTEAIEIIHGACDTGELTFTGKDGTMIYGVDGLAERYAMRKKYQIKRFPPDKKNHGNKKAYYFRNKAMSEYGTHLIAFHDGSSKGTAMMIRLATDQKLKVKIVNYKNM